ncbi:MAG: hypothetical protein WC100_01590 [Sterolibacterium sp.]
MSKLFSQPPVSSFRPTVIPDDVPVYRIKEGKFYADDYLFDEGSIVVWEEEPNLEMEPLNEMAHDNMIEYLRKLDELGKEAAKAAGKQWISYESAFANSMALAKEDGKRVTLLNGKAEVPLMGGQRRGPAKARQIELDTTPQQPVVRAGGRKAVNAIADKGIGNG